jgi:ankyrin repeat protein
MGVNLYQPEQIVDNSLVHELTQFFLGFSCIDPVGFPGRAAVILAAKSGNNELLKGLASMERFDPNVCDEFGNTALLLCCVNFGNIEGIKLLASHPKTVLNHQNVNGASAFVLAARNGQLEILRFLAQCKAFDLERSNVWLALTSAIEKKHSPVIDYILSLDFDINCRRRCATRKKVYGEGEVELHCGRVEIVLSTVLEAAAVYTNTDAIAKIAAHPRFDRSNRLLRSAMEAAVRAKKREGIQAIWNICKDVFDLRGDDGYSFLIEGCGCWEDNGFVQMMTSLPGFKITPVSGSKALAYCVTSGECALIPSIAAIPGVDVNATVPRMQGVSYAMPPIIASVLSREDELDIEKGDSDGCLEALLDVPSINVNVIGEQGVPLLMTATKIGAIEYMFRMQMTLDVNVRDSSGRTALMYAVRRKDVRAISLLCHLDIDRDAKDSRGRTAWDMAFFDPQKPKEIPPQPKDLDKYVKAISGQLCPEKKRGKRGGEGHGDAALMVRGLLQHLAASGFDIGDGYGEYDEDDDDDY